MIRLSYKVITNGNVSQCKEVINVDTVEKAKEYVLNEWRDADKIEFIENNEDVGK